METIGIVLNVGVGQVEEFERGFREMEAPVWADLRARGVLSAATLSRLDISTQSRDGAVQYLVVAIFATDEGPHLHDPDPRAPARQPLDPPPPVDGEARAPRSLTRVRGPAPARASPGPAARAPPRA